MKRRIILIIACLCVLFGGLQSLGAESKSNSTRKERRAILAGNKLYKESKYAEAAARYREALSENPSSTVATYNLGLTNLRLAAAPGVTDENKKKYIADGSKLLKSVESLGEAKANLASRAAYNLGNVAFNSEDYQTALQQYKQALRLNPNDNEARRNLRITQLKMQNNKDKNQDKNKDKNKDKDKDKEQNKDKNQENKNENKDNKDKDQEQQKPQQNTPDNQISEQTADQILKAMENKEAQTRVRVMNPQKSQNSRPNRKNW